MDQIHPIFIVGSSRSGTTMMNRILGLNNDVLALNELHYFGVVMDPYGYDENLESEQAVNYGASLISKINNGTWTKSPSNSDKKLAMELFERSKNSTYLSVYSTVLNYFSCINNRKFVIDQTPKNIFYIRRLLALYPNAHAINMVRDPRAVLCSQRNRWKIGNLGAEVPIYQLLRTLVNYHPVSTSILWKKSVNVGLKIEDHPRAMTVNFDSLLQNPDIIISNLCKFIGVDYSSKMLQVPNIGSSNMMHDGNKKGIVSKVADSWKTSLPKGEIFICELITRNEMQRLGYKPISHKIWALYTFGSLFRLPFHLIGMFLVNPKFVRKQLQAMLRSE